MAKQKTLYFLQTYGQMGNQLALMAHLLAFGIEYNYLIVYPHSDDLCKYLEVAKSKDSRIKFRRQSSDAKRMRIIHKVLELLFLKRNGRLFKYLVLNDWFIVDKDFDKINQPDVMIVNDWKFRYFEGIVKHQEAIRKELAFTTASVQEAQQRWTSLQAAYPQHTFIGVHVRRGDYAAWLDGIYFYDNDTYYKWLVQLSAQIEKSVFIICSNEDINFKNENNLDIAYIKGSPAEDLFLLSCCNYIIGPPSTFSSWSAFLGDQELLFLRSRDEDVRVEKFEKYYIK